MERLLKQRHVEPVQAALDRLPPLMRQRVEHAHFMLDVDPFFLGFYYDGLPEAYRASAACFYDFHQPQLARADRNVTVVIPHVDRLIDGRRLPLLGADENLVGLGPLRTMKVILHELGHLLHYDFGLVNVACATTVYSRRNHREAFAEAFAIRYAREFFMHVEPEAVPLADGDECMRELFERLETCDHTVSMYVPPWPRRRLAWT